VNTDTLLNGEFYAACNSLAQNKIYFGQKEFIIILYAQTCSSDSQLHKITCWLIVKKYGIWLWIFTRFSPI